MDEVLDIVDVLEISTIDILKSIVEEFNIFGNVGGDRGMMNIPRSNYIYDAIKFSGYNEDDLDEVRKIIKENKPADISIFDWFDGKSSGQGVEIGTTHPIKDASIHEEAVTEDTDDVSPADLFRDEDCGKGAFRVKITARYSDIGKRTETNQGQVLTDPTTDGFILIKDNWDEDIDLFLILQKKQTISVYSDYNLV